MKKNASFFTLLRKFIQTYLVGFEPKNVIYHGFKIDVRVTIKLYYLKIFFLPFLEYMD